MMKICRFALMIMVAASLGLWAVEPKDVAGRQIELCMIGDSITWAQEGDYFRMLGAKMPTDPGLWLASISQALLGKTEAKHSMYSECIHLCPVRRWKPHSDLNWVRLT